MPKAAARKSQRGSEEFEDVQEDDRAGQVVLSPAELRALVADIRHQAQEEAEWRRPCACVRVCVCVRASVGPHRRLSAHRHVGCHPASYNYEGSVC